jgi:hypothetical protein
MPDGVDCGMAPDYNRDTGDYEPTVYQMGEDGQPTGLLSPNTPTTSTAYQKLSLIDADSERVKRLSDKLATYVVGICAVYDELACNLWKRFGDLSGRDFTVDPGELAKDKDFARVIEDSKDELIKSAMKACPTQSNEECRYRIDSRWQDGDFEVDGSNHNGIGHFKYRLEGSLTLTRSSDGAVAVKGSYRLTMFKRWNFDREDTAYLPGIGKVSLEPFAEMPAAGVGRPFDLEGVSDEIPFSGTL